MEDEIIDRNTLGSFKGIPYESQEELFILYWLLELGEKDFIYSIERAEAFPLGSTYQHKYIRKKQLKTKTILEEKNQTLLHKHIYTPEFKVLFNSHCPLLFDTNSTIEQCMQPLIGNKVITEDGPISFYTTAIYIECKPDFDQNNMTRLFKINQKWMWDKYKIFVNLLKPKELFEKTFTPQLYLTTKINKPRKITWEVKSLDEYLKSLNFED